MSMKKPTLAPVTERRSSLEACSYRTGPVLPRPRVAAAAAVMP